MAKNKLSRFAENEGFKNLVQPTREEVVNDFEHKAKWSSFFKNSNPIILELGCGKGEYSVELARRFPDKNFIGIDLKGARLWRGAKTALEEGLTNVAFVRTQIELIEHIFAKNEVSEIWITFPDPQIKYRRAKHRLTHPIFLKRYQEILGANGIVHLKTDSEFLHGYTLGILQGLNIEPIKSNHDIYHDPRVDLPEVVLQIQTFYEQMFLKENKSITYLQFSFD